MDEQVALLTEESKRLQRCMNDMVSLVALPSLWSGCEPAQMLEKLLEVLLAVLGADFAYARSKDPVSDVALEIVRAAESRIRVACPLEIGKLLNVSLGDDPQKWPSQGRITVDGRDISLISWHLTSEGEVGVVVTGSERADFPKQTERVLFSMAVNQTAIALKEARLRAAQKQIADELDRRVAQRTQELAETNEELRKEIAERRKAEEALRVSWFVMKEDINGRKRAEEALRASERNLKQIINTIPILVWSSRPDGSAEFFNQHYLDFVGVPQELLQGRGWTDAVHPDDLNSVITAWEFMMAHEKAGECEGRLRRFDGEYRWFLFRTNPLRDESGKIVKWYGTNTDIEDRKRAEEKTRLIIETALDAVVTIDAEGKVTAWNKQAEAIFGWKRQEAIGRGLSEMIIPEHQQAAHARGLRHFLANGEGRFLGRRIEVTAIRRTGVEFPVELEVIPLRLGKDWNFSAFIRDITDAKRAEAQLKESELNLRQLTETIPEMLWSATPDGSIDYCNTRLLDYSGFQAGEVMERNWTKLLHPDDVERADQAWRSSIESGAPYRVEVRTFHVADHTYRWCVASALPLLGPSGSILRWHGTVVDMHDWKEAQEQLRNSQAELAHVTRVMMMGELTASIAHEVNQPLSGIITNASTCLRLLAADPPNLDAARETARRTIRDGNRASEVVTRLRALYSKKDVAPESVDLNQAAREVITLTASELQRSRVTLREVMAENLPVIIGDRVQLQQVILNLLLNACDAMRSIEDRPRLLVIKTEQEPGDRVCLTMQDSGVGFGDHGLDKLFEAFYTTKSGGMGIGLSVSRSIIERHRGRLWAIPNDGPGATFAFSIPLRAEREPRAHSSRGT